MERCKCPLCAGRRSFVTRLGDAQLGQIKLRADPDRVAVIISPDYSLTAGVLNTFQEGRAFLWVGDAVGVPFIVINWANSPYIFRVEQFGQLVISDLTVQANLTTTCDVMQVVLREEHDDLGSMRKLSGK
jgi:hypothetical protein